MAWPSPPPRFCAAGPVAPDAAEAAAAAAVAAQRRTLLHRVLSRSRFTIVLDEEEEGEKCKW